ncbi:hypothetical protein ACTFIV_009627 [Dictyostelium citrinum]
MKVTLVVILVIFLNIYFVSSQFVETLNIYRCSNNSTNQWSNATSVTDFTLTSNYGLAVQQTFASICYDDQYINIKAYCIDNNIISPYNSCNQDLFNADVFETFISYGPADEVAVNYLEVELSPYGVLFVSLVNNPNDECDGIQDTLVDCGQSGIIYGASTVNDGWEGTLRIPYQLIQKASQHSETEGYIYKFNMFRIDVPLNNYKEFSCYHADNTNPPCFHVPSYFGNIALN